jgi:hypothetical protein
MTDANYSVLRAGKTGALTTALTAISDAANPVTRTDSKSNPNETADKRPPRAINAGMIASSAHKTPVNNPHPSIKLFSGQPLNQECSLRYPIARISASSRLRSITLSNSTAAKP